GLHVDGRLARGELRERLRAARVEPREQIDQLVGVAAQRLELLAGDEARQGVARADVVRGERAVERRRALAIAEPGQQVGDLEPAVVLERVRGEDVIEGGEGRAHLPRAQQGAGLGLQLSQLDAHCADVSLSMKYDPAWSTNPPCSPRSARSASTSSAGRPRV